MFSLTNQWFSYGAENKWLNPSNEDQSRLSTYVGKPTRLFARLLYGLGGVAIGPAVGVTYHGVKVFKKVVMKTHANKQNESKKTWEHVKAAALDGILLTIFVVGLANFSMSLLLIRDARSQLKENKIVNITNEAFLALSETDPLLFISIFMNNTKNIIFGYQYRLGILTAILQGVTFLYMSIDAPLKFACFPDVFKK